MHTSLQGWYIHVKISVQYMQTNPVRLEGSEGGLRQQLDSFRWISSREIRSTLSSSIYSKLFSIAQRQNVLRYLRNSVFVTLNMFITRFFSNHVVAERFALLHLISIIVK